MNRTEQNHSLSSSYCSTNLHIHHRERLLIELLRIKSDEFMLRSIISRCDAAYWENMAVRCANFVDDESDQGKRLRTNLFHGGEHNHHLYQDDNDDDTAVNWCEDIINRQDDICSRERVDAIIQGISLAFDANSLEPFRQSNEFSKIVGHVLAHQAKIGTPSTNPKRKRTHDVTFELLGEGHVKLSRWNVVPEECPKKVEQPGKKIVHIDGNQYTMGGSLACTSISFVAASAMRDKKTPDDISNNIRWNFVLETGVSLWRLWCTKYNAKTPGFQTLEQIRKMPEMKRTFQMLGGSPEEYGGRIDNFVPSEYMKSVKKIREYQVIFPSLGKALDIVSNKGVVAIITIGVTSVSLWTRRYAGVEEEATFVIFDSHGTQTRSTLITCVGVAETTRTILKICHAGPDYCRFRNKKKSRKKRMVGTVDATGTYCMYSFSVT